MTPNVISFIIQFCFTSFEVLFSTTDFFQPSSGRGLLLRGVVKWIRVEGVRRGKRVLGVIGCKRINILQ
jgi:hypothetical protein